VYILGEQEVPSLTTLTTDVIQVTPRIHYKRFLAIKEIDNGPEVRESTLQPVSSILLAGQGRERAPA
jgi:hypothetical protein